MRQKNGYLYQFGQFVLDTSQHLLLREAIPVSLTPKTYDALLVLVQNAGRMLAKDELMKALWPNSFVEESNLTQQISMIRRALGESAGEDRYIVTIPSRGYRFAAEVKVVPVQADVPEIESIPSPPAIGRRRIAIAALAAIVLGLLGFAYAYYNRHSITEKPGALRSVAILPFQSLRRDNADNDFLGFSLADAVITKLEYVSSVTVRPSSSIERYRNQIMRSPQGCPGSACRRDPDRKLPARRQ